MVVRIAGSELMQVMSLWVFLWSLQYTGSRNVEFMELTRVSSRVFCLFVCTLQLHHSNCYRFCNSVFPLHLLIEWAEWFAARYNGCVVPAELAFRMVGELDCRQLKVEGKGQERRRGKKQWEELRKRRWVNELTWAPLGTCPTCLNWIYRGI